MDTQEHKQAFDRVVAKYNLADEKKAGEVADFLTKHKVREFSTKEFADAFGMDPEDANVFLSFIQKGLSFREQYSHG